MQPIKASSSISVIPLKSSGSSSSKQKVLSKRFSASFNFLISIVPEGYFRFVDTISLTFGNNVFENLIYSSLLSPNLKRLTLGNDFLLQSKFKRMPYKSPKSTSSVFGSTLISMQTPSLTKNDTLFLFTHSPIEL